ncbi:HigA family addiction module antitoxin [Segatella copri]|uniref:HigA family addiction module antitoxin n=1 Tax=Segatella copri TaxID=165179 RepID=UPI001C444712|nr:HigA family addiction module antitoxin [Segatella copri]MBW0027510.1 HigA family addiction module antidote protein [Segatella copri]
MSNDNKTTKEMRANEMTPAFPTHPGDVLKDEIEYRGISQRQLAEEMGIAYSALNEILNARRPVTEKTALLFEAALGVNAEPLLKMQMRYNLQSTKNDSTFMARLAKVRRVAAAL